MSSTVNRTPKSGGRGRQSLFFRDLASPVSTRRGGGSGKFSTPGQAAAVSALWRENFASSDLPPPPMFTLEDRSDFSPESGIADYPISPDASFNHSNPRTPIHGYGGNDYFSTPKTNKSVNANSTSSFSLIGNKSEGASSSYAALTSTQSPAASASWWSTPVKSGSGSESDNRGKGGSPVEGVVHPGALITLPPPREVARPEMERNSLLVGALDEEEWVTVYGFSPGDTNLVLREFERCGVILKHVPGPRDANWMHILYQSRADAQLWSSFLLTLSTGILLICFQKPPTDWNSPHLYSCWVTQRVGFCSKVFIKAIEHIPKFCDLNQPTYWIIGIGFIWMSIWIFAVIGALNFYFHHWL